MRQGNESARPTQARSTGDLAANFPDDYERLQREQQGDRQALPDWTDEELDRLWRESLEDEAMARGLCFYDEAEGKICPRCREEWPLTADFFRRLMGRRWQSWCRACEAEWVAEKRRAAAAS